MPALLTLLPSSMNRSRAAIYVITVLLATVLPLVGCSYTDTSPQIRASDIKSSNQKSDIKYVIPNKSSLHLAESKEFDHLLFFAGTVEVHARYEFIYEKDSERSNNPYLVIHPGADSLELLPYLPDSDDKGYPSAIYIQNADYVARSMFGRSQLSKMKSGVNPVTSGLATFTIEGYWMGYECDSPAFTARITSARNIEINTNQLGSHKYQAGC